MHAPSQAEETEVTGVIGLSLDHRGRRQGSWQRPETMIWITRVPEIGDGLKAYRRGWTGENCTKNILNIITNGYALPFSQKPKLVRLPLMISVVLWLQCLPSTFDVTGSNLGPGTSCLEVGSYLMSVGSQCRILTN